MALGPWKGLFNEAAGAAKTKNAVQSVVWLCGILSVPCFYLATFASPPLNCILVGIGTLPIAQFLVAYNYFMIKDPDRLGSEEYQLKTRALDIVESKGGDIKISPIDLRNITNPESGGLPRPEKGAEKS